MSDPNYARTREQLLKEIDYYTGVIVDLRDELATLKEQNAMLTVQVQEGWKLVPVEPTEEMLFAAETSQVRGYHDLYRAMLAAAPALPQQVKSEDARDDALQEKTK